MPGLAAPLQISRIQEVNEKTHKHEMHRPTQTRIEMSILIYLMLNLDRFKMLIKFNSDWYVTDNAVLLWPRLRRKLSTTSLGWYLRLPQPTVGNAIDLALSASAIRRHVDIMRPISCKQNIQKIGHYLSPSNSVSLRSTYLRWTSTESPFLHCI